jgi:hypothetical protein
MAVLGGREGETPVATGGSAGKPAPLPRVPRDAYHPRMNAAVALVRTYLNLNGFFTVAELPVIRRNRDGSFDQVTDIDILALRFPRAGHIVARGLPGAEDDLTFAHDPALDVSSSRMDLIIGEVKQGKPRFNPALREPDALTTALVRTGCCPPAELPRVVDALRSRGEAYLSAESAGIPCRIRLLAFGDTPLMETVPGVPAPQGIVPLARVSAFIQDHLRHYRAILHPVHLSDPTLGLMHLLEKLK